MPTSKKPTSRSSRSPGRPNADFFRRRALPPAPTNPASRELTAVIQAVAYTSSDGTFAILRGEDPDGTRVSLKGPLGHVHVGETLACRGEWKHHSEHGWSFQVEHATVTQPHTLVGMVAYLESAVKGIGPIFAKAIVDTLGERTFEAIDEDPNVLFKVRTPSGQKMGAAKIRAIVEAWEEARAIRKVMVFLTSHGVTTGIATKIHKQYGDDALKVLGDDPYRIVEIRGIGFKIADRIARNLNVPLESPQRIQAGIVYVLQDAESSGHCFLHEEELTEVAVEQLMLERDTAVREQLESLIRERKVIVESSESGNRLYLPELFFVERRLAKHMRELLATQPAVDIVVPERPTSGDFIPNDGQWQAIEHALRRRVSLITGLPGTGKTTLVKLLLSVIDAQPDMVLGPATVRYVLASPTGKAARRLTEASGVDAQTIHRLLQWAPGEGGFQHDEENPLDARFVIIDETSMVDLRLADALVRAIGPSTHLVLVGDADQLPPVGAGKVFEDLIASREVPSVRLTEIFRQAARSMIVRNAHRIVHGDKPFKNAKAAAEELPDTSVEDLDDDFFFVGRDEPDQVAATIVEFAARRIPATYGLDPIRDVMVLAPMKKGPCGLEELNRQLQHALNPTGPRIGVRDLRVGDRIIQTRNDYDIEVMNGEVGVLAAHDTDDATVTLDFGDRVRTVAISDLDTFMLAYAISVHRSQGSQAPAVVCAVATSHWIMLTRSLVNTAITRAQKLCVCVGQQRAMTHAVRTLDTRTRNTALAERIRR
jgi:exodeoxyribonuclease V alpha subunit